MSLFILVLQFTERYHSFDSLLPSISVVFPQHPLPDVIHCQVNTCFQLNISHWQPFYCYSMFHREVKRDLFHSIVIDYASYYIDQSALIICYSGSNSSISSVASPVRYTSFSFGNNQRKEDGSILMPHLSALYLSDSTFCL